MNRPDGEAKSGLSSVTLPVRTADGARAVVKIGWPGRTSEHEHLVLRRWGGDGAVRLLRADPRRRALLLERLHPQDLRTLTDAEACEVVAGLYRRIHIPAMPQLPTPTSLLEQWAGDFEALPRSAPIPHRLVEQAIAWSRDLATDPVSARSVVHGNLHYAKVLAADREPWLAIAPKPINGDPHYELAPMLWNRWDELTGHVRDGIRHRLYTLVDTAGLDDEPRPREPAHV
ncbi:MAG TPA: aminoglycoside phosphotransferase family protein, partial [Mycobacterium sp.]|nr:aminoglycoside phosphotransferase family protein [Mycobacterium sp.]